MIRNGALDVVQGGIERQQHPFYGAVRPLTCARLRAMLDVLYRTADLLAINKPSGISLLADRSGAPCLWDTLREELAARRSRTVFGASHRQRHQRRVVGCVDARAPVATDRKRSPGATYASSMSRACSATCDLGGRTGMIDLPLAKGRKSRYRVAAPRERITRHGCALASDRTIVSKGTKACRDLRRIGGDGRQTLLALQPLDRADASVAGSSRVDRPSDRRRSPLRQARCRRNNNGRGSHCIAIASSSTELRLPRRCHRSSR